MPSESDRRSLWPFIALEAATMLAGTGNGVAAIALPWLTLRLTNDPAAAGMVVAASALPTLIASLGSGVIIDRLGHRRTSVGSDIFSAISAGAIPVMGLLGVLTYPLLLVASVVGAVFDPVGVTAREAMLPNVAEKARLKLERVNGVHEATWNLAWLIGPGVAGLLIAAVGAVAAFWAMCAGFVASALLVATVRMPRPEPEGEKRHWLGDALDGLRYVIGEPAIRSTTVLATVSFAIAFALIGVVLPVVYERLDQPQQLGGLFVAFSAGGVVGALVYSGIATKLKRRPVFVIGLAAMATIGVLYVFSPPFWVQLVAMAVGGFLTGGVAPVMNVVLQERTDERMRGRALSMVFALDYALYPVAYAGAGFMVKWFGVRSTFAWLAAGMVAAAVWAMLTPALRTMEELPAPRMVVE